MKRFLKAYPNSKSLKEQIFELHFTTKSLENVKIKCIFAPLRTMKPVDE